MANPHAWTDYLGLAPDCIPIHRTPKGTHAQYELDHGPNPANHQPGVDIGGGITGGHSCTPSAGTTMSW
ncbi:hypothetical protein [Streptomyces vinaceus]|uniref:hypothetical protein n=1 Tax=Streptomyces vinaceus TaxID=1960 RepID=UPI0036799225